MVALHRAFDSARAKRASSRRLYSANQCSEGASHTAHQRQSDNPKYLLSHDLSEDEFIAPN